MLRLGLPALTAVLATLTLLLPGGRAAGAVPVSGVLLCDDCPGGVTLSVGGAPADAGERLLFSLGLARPGPFAFSVDDTLRSLSLFAFSDEDGDGVPDGGTEIVAYPGNPVELLGGEVAALRFDLSGLTGAGGPAAQRVLVSGSVLCADCAGPVTLRVHDARGPGRSAPVISRLLDGPGPFSQPLPRRLGSVHLMALRDGDADGSPDPGTELAACQANPVSLAAGDVAELVLDLGTLPEAALTLAGELRCPDCAGAISVSVRRGAAGELVALRSFERPGPYSLGLPRGLGPVSVHAFRDADRDGQPDLSLEPTGAPGNPLLAQEQDLEGVDIALAPLPGVVALSGMVICPSCPGGVTLSLGRAGGPEGGPVFALRALDGPGPFALHVPAGLGEVELAAFSDPDRDGRPDDGVSPTQAADNPINVADRDIGGLLLELEPPPSPDSVRLTGEIRCADCAGGVTLELRADGGFEVAPLVRHWIPAAGPFSLVVPADLGPVTLWAFRDADADGRADNPDDPDAYVSSPLVVADEDVGGLELDLGELPPHDAVRISGLVTCAHCRGGVTLRFVDASERQRGLLAQRWLPRPGPYLAVLSGGLGLVNLEGFPDSDGEGLPDPAQPVSAYPHNPLVVDAVDLAGVDLELATPAGATVRLSGTLRCATCPGAVTLQVLEPRQPAPRLLVARSLPAAGPWELLLARGPGAVEVHAFSDHDQDMAPDPGFERVAYEGNPVALEAAEAGGIDLQLDDPGVELDAGIPADGGVAADAGGTPDAGGAPDAGAPADTGAPADGGFPADSGDPMDVAPPPDGGSTDAQRPSDAEAPLDTGQTSDQGLRDGGADALDAGAGDVQPPNDSGHRDGGALDARVDEDTSTTEDAGSGVDAAPADGGVDLGTVTPDNGADPPRSDASEEHDGGGGGVPGAGGDEGCSCGTISRPGRAGSPSAPRTLLHHCFGGLLLAALLLLQRRRSSVCGRRTQPRR